MYIHTRTILTHTHTRNYRVVVLACHTRVEIVSSQVERGKKDIILTTHTHKQQM